MHKLQIIRRQAANNGLPSSEMRLFVIQRFSHFDKLVKNGIGNIVIRDSVDVFSVFILFDFQDENFQVIFICFRVTQGEIAFTFILQGGEMLENSFLTVFIDQFNEFVILGIVLRIVKFVRHYCFLLLWFGNPAIAAGKPRRRLCRPSSFARRGRDRPQEERPLRRRWTGVRPERRR